MPAYVIGTLEISNPAPLAEYNDKIGAVLAQFGGRIIGAGPVSQVLEGTARPNLTAIMEFPSAEDALRWYESPAYGEIRGLRQGSGRTAVWLVDAAAPPPVTSS